MLVSSSLARKVIKRKLKELSLGSTVPTGLSQFIKEVQKLSKYRVILKMTPPAETLKRKRSRDLAQNLLSVKKALVKFSTSKTCGTI